MVTTFPRTSSVGTPGSGKRANSTAVSRVGVPVAAVVIKWPSMCGILPRRRGRRKPDARDGTTSNHVRPPRLLRLAAPRAGRAQVVAEQLVGPPHRPEGRGQFRPAVGSGGVLEEDALARQPAVEPQPVQRPGEVV